MSCGSEFVENAASQSTVTFVDRMKFWTPFNKLNTSQLIQSIIYQGHTMLHANSDDTLANTPFQNLTGFLHAAFGLMGAPCENNLIQNLISRISNRFDRGYFSFYFSIKYLCIIYRSASTRQPEH